MIRHSTLPAPSHRGFAPPTQPHHPNSSYTPIVIQSAILIVSKAARFRKTSVHRRHETLRQYIYRARDDGLWRDDVTREGLQVWLETYESVRFGGIELSEAEFVATMKLVHFLLMEMKPPLSAEFSVDSAEWSSSSVSLGSVDESLMETDVPALVRSPSTRNDRYRDWDVLRQMDMILSSPRKSVDEVSLSSMIDHGSTFEHALDQEQNRRMRGGRLGEREGSVIYYDVKDD